MFRTLNYTILLTSLLLSATFQVAASIEPPQVTHLYSFSEGLDAPVRIAADGVGNFYVTDIRRDRVCVLDDYGNLLRYLYGIRTPLSVAVDHQDRIYVGGEKTRTVAILTPEGDFLGALGIGQGQFTEPTDMAIDSQNNIYVVDSRENCVKVFGENREYLFQFGDSILQYPTGIAIDEANDAILVGQYGGLENGKTTSRVQIFDMQGEWRSSFGSYGEKPGEFTRIQGLAVDGEGRIYVTDSYQANVQVVDYSGNPLVSIGSYGDGSGELRVPFDVLIDLQNRLWITSVNTGRIEVFGIDEYGSPGDQTPVVDRFSVNLVAGINFVSVPLKPVEEEWRLSDLAAHIGDGVISIITYSSEQEGASSYLPSFPEDDPGNILVKGSDSYIVIMWNGKTVTFEGTAWEGEVSFPAGMSMFAVPLEPAEQWQLGDLAHHIGEEVTHLITFDRSTSTFETYTPGIDPSSDVSVEGGMGCLAVMSGPKTVVFEGEAWKNEEAIPQRLGTMMWHRRPAHQCWLSRAEF